MLTLSKYNNVFKNISWLLFDKFLKLFVGLSVLAMVARHLGPANFGTYNYLIAIISVLLPLTSFGIDNILIRELALDHQKKHNYLSSAILLKIIGGSTCFLAVLIFQLFGNHSDANLLILMSFVLMFQWTSVFDLYFQSKIESKYSVIASSSSFILFSLIRILLVFFKKTLIYFCFAYVLELVFIGLILIFFSQKKIPKIRLFFHKKSLLKLINDGWPFFLSGIAVSVFMKIDQLMLKHLLNDKAVGIYSAALKVSEVWYFIPTIIISTLAPVIYMRKSVSRIEYLKALEKIFFYLIIIAMLITISTIFISDLIIEQVYGLEYREASNVLKAHIFATIFVFIGSAQSLYWTAENLQKLSLFFTISSALINIVLNFYLIPFYGPSGAAYATLISYGIPTIFFPLLFSKSKLLFYMNFSYIAHVIFGKIIIKDLKA
jgi:O-antigen/teichoic acid export membrane protein